MNTRLLEGVVVTDSMAMKLRVDPQMPFSEDFFLKPVLWISMGFSLYDDGNKRLVLLSEVILSPHSDP